MEKVEDKCTICEDKRLYTEILDDWLTGVIQKNSGYEFFSIVELDERLEDPVKTRFIPCLSYPTG